jgi:CRISPR-associated protein Cas2
MVVVAYDITDEKRLQKVAKYMEQHGVRVQKSVFELDMEFREAKQIVKGALKLIDKERDKIFIFQVKEKEDLQGDTSISRII